MLSIVFPGYRHENWERLFLSIRDSMGSTAFEVIAVGPPMPEAIAERMSIYSEFQAIVDYGTPTRCAQIALLEAKGEIFTWVSDDGVYMGLELNKSYELLKSKSTKDGVCIRYHEGGNNVNDSYWVATTHNDLRMSGVKSSFIITPLGMYYTEYVKSIGGWDCNFEHLNMSNHDLAFRIQNDGGKIFLSPSFTFTCEWSGGRPDHKPIHDSHFENDAPLLESLYSIEGNRSVNLELDNWKNSPATWSRRFG
jgi:hypothetical protein